jgi:hypothetical protein
VTSCAGTIGVVKTARFTARARFLRRKLRGKKTTDSRVSKTVRRRRRWCALSSGFNGHKSDTLSLGNKRRSCKRARSATSGRAPVTCTERTRQRGTAHGTHTRVRMSDRYRICFVRALPSACVMYSFVSRNEHVTDRRSGVVRQNNVFLHPEKHRS